MTRKVLIVSPLFSSGESPDVHRARTMLNHLAENGWKGSVLALNLSPAEADPRLTETFPQDTPIRRSACLPSLPGAQTLGWRSWPFLRRQGSAWIDIEKPDLIFFTTTVHSIFGLGPAWKKKHGIPYVLDYQDPWVTQYYEQEGAPKPPGGRWKYRIHQWFARKQEPVCVEQAAGVAAVSETYLQELRGRYPKSQKVPMRAIPFGVSGTDWAQAKQLGKTPWKKNGSKIWLNLGRLAPSMKGALEAFFCSLAVRPPAEGTKILFLGTSYQTGNVSEIDPVGMAKRICPAAKVEATPGRLPLLDALKALQEADRLLLFGSEDPGYMPSRLFQYLMAEKPLLGVLHPDSPAYQIMQKCGAPGLVALELQGGSSLLAKTIACCDWEKPALGGATIYTAAQMTKDLCELFEQA